MNEVDSRDHDGRLHQVPGADSSLVLVIRSQWAILAAALPRKSFGCVDVRLTPGIDLLSLWQGGRVMTLPTTQEHATLFAIKEVVDPYADSAESGDSCATSDGCTSEGCSGCTGSHGT